MSRPMQPPVVMGCSTDPCAQPTPSAVEPTATKGIPVDLESYPRRRLYDCVRHHPLPVLAISTAVASLHQCRPGG